MKQVFLLVFALLPMLTDAQPSYTPIRQALNTGQWEFRQAGKPDWKPVKVPVSVHTALLQNDMIEDPFCRYNE